MSVESHTPEFFGSLTGPVLNSRNRPGRVSCCRRTAVSGAIRLPAGPAPMPNPSNSKFENRSSHGDIVRPITVIMRCIVFDSRPSTGPVTRSRRDRRRSDGSARGRRRARRLMAGYRWQSLSSDSCPEQIRELDEFAGVLTEVSEREGMPQGVRRNANALDAVNRA